MPDIAYCKVHPGIGIARLGTSPDEYYIGSEAPGRPTNPDAAFKDREGRVKRQAARFRIYAYDAADNVLGELTAADATICWTVHLANRKAAAPHFQDRFQTDAPKLRNPDVKDRSTLVNDPGARSIAGADQSGAPYRCEGGRCFGVAVPLGELRTDADGRLLVLGGRGHSDSPSGAFISTYANNDGWYDDASDGPVTATVTLADGTAIADVRGAWVIVAPPKFTPAHQNIVTLYDVMCQVAVDQQWLPAPSAVSFTRDIYPILARAAGLQWLNATVNRGHGASPDGNFLSPELLPKLAAATAETADLRQAIFARLREPDKLDPAQANFYYMPQLSGDGGDATDGDPKTWLTLTRGQYEAMRKWAQGQFNADWQGEPEFPALEELPAAARPGALDRAALEACVGGPFYPGIEMTYIALDPALYAEPFRLTPSLQPGEITQHMALPWQADFYQCNTYWWPAARPDDVVSETDYQAAVQGLGPAPGASGPDAPAPGGAPAGTAPMAQRLSDRSPWARGLSDDYPDPDYLARRTGDSDMVRFWSQLGFVVPRKAPTGETVYIETERHPYAGLDTRDAYHRLLNSSANTDFLPKARELAELCLSDVRRRTAAPDLDETLRFFPYTADALSARLDWLYGNRLRAADEYDPAADPVFQNRQDVVERLRQLAPFFQLDGAWLRGCLKGGPLDETTGPLFAIWQELNGGGRPDLSLPNLYTTLLDSVDLRLPPVDSLSYARNPDLLESAFTLPLFGLCLAQFTESYLPELLGFTLAATWAAANLDPVIALLRKYRIDAHFFTVRQGLANLVEGHGAKAKAAVMAYLDAEQARAGEAGLTAAWERIWTGFAGFHVVSQLDQDLQHLLDGRRKPDLEAAVEDLIFRKQPYAQLAHGDAKLGPNYINDWFQDPAGFLAEMQKQGLLIPGDPDHSPFFRLLTFDGPMYKVFTDAEVQLLREYVISLGTGK